MQNKVKFARFSDILETLVSKLAINGYLGSMQFKENKVRNMSEI